MVSGTEFHCRILKREPWSMSKIKSNGNTKSQTSHEEESQNPSGAEVSLDNVDTVIEGAHPNIAPFATFEVGIFAA